MKLLKYVVLLALIPTLTFAQRGGSRGGGGGGFRGGSGGGGFRSGAVSSGGFRGGFSSGGFRGGFSGGGSSFRGGGFSGGGFRGGFAGNRFGGFRGGFNHFGGTRFVFGFGGYGGWPYYWGYPYAYGAWPGYYYGGGYPYYPYDYGYDYGYGYTAAPAYQSSPPVVIEQNYPPSAPSTGGSGDSFYRRPDYYLIAFTDHTIQAAVSYSVEGDQIRWTTREHVEKQAPLSSVDRRFTEQINRDRHVEIKLP